jgi:HEAT repeat protein
MIIWLASYPRSGATLAVVETSRSNWGVTPRESVERACAARGRSVVVDGCVALLSGATDVDRTLIYALGGPPARWAVSGGESGPDYWLRVWAARGLLWAWDERALPVVKTALSDPAWRVREAAARIAARHQLGDLLHDLEALRDDDANRRVASAADRAITRIFAAGT